MNSNTLRPEHIELITRLANQKLDLWKNDLIPLFWAGGLALVVFTFVLAFYLGKRASETKVEVKTEVVEKNICEDKNLAYFRFETEDNVHTGILPFSGYYQKNIPAHNRAIKSFIRQEFRLPLKQSVDIEQVKQVKDVDTYSLARPVIEEPEVETIQQAPQRAFNYAG